MPVTTATRSSGNKRKSPEEAMQNQPSLDDATSNGYDNSGLHQLQPENTPPVAKKKRGGKPKGAQKFTEIDELRMLNSVGESVASGQHMGDIWRTVEAAYNRRCDEACAGRKHRDFKFLRKHFANLLSFSNPSSDPACPPNVVRAYELQRAIEETHIIVLGDSEEPTSTRKALHPSQKMFPIASTRPNATGTAATPARGSIVSADGISTGYRTGGPHAQQKAVNAGNEVQADHDAGVRSIAQGPVPTHSATQPAPRQYSLIDPFGTGGETPTSRSSMSMSIEAPASVARQRGPPQTPGINSDGMPVFAPSSESQYQFYRDFVPRSCYETLEKLLLEEKMERKEAQTRAEKMERKEAQTRAEQLEKENQRLKDSHHASLLALQKFQVARQNADGVDRT